MNLGTLPGVTAIMPSLNQAQWIRQSLESLVTDAAISEILVMDQGSVDATLSIVSEYPVASVVPAGNRSVLTAIGDGIASARNEWVIVATTSDWFEPQAVSILRASAMRDPRLTYVGAGTIVHETTGERRLKLPVPGWLTLDDVIDGGQMPGITLFRRSVTLAVGWPSLRDDAMCYLGYLLYTLTHGGTARRLARPLINFRRHGGSISGSEIHARLVHQENAIQRQQLAVQYADVLTPTQRERLLYPTGHERLWRRTRRGVVGWRHAPVSRPADVEEDHA